MYFSYKSFTPVVTNNKLDKHTAMMRCVTDFEAVKCDRLFDKNELQKFGKFLQNYLVYSNIVWKDNHRKKENALLENIDILILDIDSGIDIDDVLKNVPFQIMTLTTTSHTPEHHKFRIFIPLKKSITFKSNNHYKEFLKLVDSKYFDSKSDKRCFESGRAYITTEKAEYQLNNSDEIFDPTNFIIEANKNTLTEGLQSINLFESQSVSTKTYSIGDVLRFPKTQSLIQELGKGNHYSPVYKIMGIGKRAGLSDNDCISMILRLNIGKEYSDYNSLLKKVQRYN